MHLTRLTFRLLLRMSDVRAAQDVKTEASLTSEGVVKSQSVCFGCRPGTRPAQRRFFWNGGPRSLPFDLHVPGLANPQLNPIPLLVIALVVALPAAPVSNRLLHWSLALSLSPQGDRNRALRQPAVQRLPLAALRERRFRECCATLPLLPRTSERPQPGCLSRGATALAAFVYAHYTFLQLDKETSFLARPRHIAFAAVPARS